MVAPFRVVPLADAHDRTAFTCGVPALDRYFHHQVSQDIRRRVASCFVAQTQEGVVAGYYTLASTSVALSDLPAAVAKKLPRYPLVPAVRMGRLAVGNPYRGTGLGAALLANALQRASRAEIAAYALVVDAKDAQAAAFYTHHGLIALPDVALTLFMPLASVAALVQAASKPSRSAGIERQDQQKTPACEFIHATYTVAAPASF
jgi:predicted GNAT family N-acyltransferase